MENGSSSLVLVSDIYPDNIVVLPLEGRPIFPGLTIPLGFPGKSLVSQIEYALEHNNGFIGVSLVEEKDEKDLSRSRLFKTGTLLKVIKVINRGDDFIQLFAQAVTRYTAVKSTSRKCIPHWQVQYDYERQSAVPLELKAYTLAVINSVKEHIRLNPMFQEQMKLALSQVGMEKPGLLMDLVASFLTAQGAKLQEILEAFDLFTQSEKLLLLLKEEIELSLLLQDIQKQIEEKVSKQQRDFFLREQLKVIKKELRLEKDDKASELEILEKKISKLQLPAEAAKVVNEEMEKLRALETGSAEYQVSHFYLN